MTNPLGDRRRAERFAQLLDEADGGRRHHLRTPYDDELADLVGVRQHLSAAGEDVEMDPEFRTGLRAMLVATAEREGIGVTAEREAAAGPSTAVRFATAASTRVREVLVRGPRARTAVIAGVAVGAVAFTGISTASENALPGDPLYGVKRSTERAQLALASSDVGRGQLYLEFAQTRLAEAQDLASDLDRVLADMDRDTSHGVRLLAIAATNRQDRAALDVIDDFVEEQREALADLAERVSVADQPRIVSSLSLLDAVSARAGELRDSLDRDCPAITSLDSLGPVPADCVALPAPASLDLDAPLATGPAPAEYGSTGDDRATDDPSGAEDAPAPTPTATSADPDADPAEPAEPEVDGSTGDRSGPESDGGTGNQPSGLFNGFGRVIGDLLGK